MPSEQSGMAVARSRSDVAGGGDASDAAPTTTLPLGSTRAAAVKTGPRQRVMSDRDANGMSAVGSQRAPTVMYCRKSTVFASADGAGPKGTNSIASEYPKSPHCKKSSGTGIWWESSA